MKKLLCVLALLALVGCQTEADKTLSPQDAYLSKYRAMDAKTFIAGKEFKGKSCTLYVRQKAGEAPNKFWTDPFGNPDVCNLAMNDIQMKLDKGRFPIKPNGLPDVLPYSYQF